MTTQLSYWESKISEKVKKTSFRDFIKHIGGWYPVTFYKRGDLVSVYPETERSPNIISPTEFGENVNQLLKYGISFDSEISFFENYEKLFKSIPLPALRQFPIVSNSVFTDSSGWGSHNCYLDIGLFDVENVLYSFEIKENCKNVLNSVMVWNDSENIYQSNCVVRSSFVFYSRYILNSSQIRFSTNLVGCHNCIFCDNLENASYHIKNKKYSKEQYNEIKNKMLRDQKNFMKYYVGLPTTGNNLVSQNVSGTYITNSKNVENGYYSYNINEGKNTVLVGSVAGNNYMYNVISSGSPTFDHGYNVINSGGGNHIYCSDFIVGSNIYYSYFLENCSFCLGCIGLKNKSFCILNKQYSKEEWYELTNTIFKQMEQDGTLGDFFPSQINPFYFNDTAASIMDSTFTKAEIEKEGYMWRDDGVKVDIPERAEVVETKNLSSFQGYNSEGNWQINPEILKKVIKDTDGNVYKIVKMEYDFLIKHGLPLPEIHWLERIKLGFKFN